MKKRIILGAIVALLVMTAMPVVAQQNGQTLMIGGLVPLRLDLTLTPDADAQNLLLTVDPGDPDTPHNPTIATLEISTNNTAGWELHVYSMNGSNLVNAFGDEIQYTIRYDGAGGTPAPGDLIPAGSGGQLIGEADNGAAPNNLADDGALIISYTRSADHPAGYYSDQLAVVLRAQ